MYHNKRKQDIKKPYKYKECPKLSKSGCSRTHLKGGGSNEKGINWWRSYGDKVSNV